MVNLLVKQKKGLPKNFKKEGKKSMSPHRSMPINAPETGDFFVRPNVNYMYFRPTYM